MKLLLEVPLFSRERAYAENLLRTDAEKTAALLNIATIEPTLHRPTIALIIRGWFDPVRAEEMMEQNMNCVCYNLRLTPAFLKYGNSLLLYRAAEHHAQTLCNAFAKEFKLRHKNQQNCGERIPRTMPEDAIIEVFRHLKSCDSPLGKFWAEILSQQPAPFYILPPKLKAAYNMHATLVDLAINLHGRTGGVAMIANSVDELTQTFLYRLAAMAGYRAKLITYCGNYHDIPDRVKRDILIHAPSSRTRTISDAEAAASTDIDVSHTDTEVNEELTPPAAASEEDSVSRTIDCHVSKKPKRELKATRGN